jgi:hypothetical protein
VITILEEIIVCKDGTLSLSEVAVNSAYVVRARESSVKTTVQQTVKFARIVTELTLVDGTFLKIAGTLSTVVTKLNGSNTNATRQPMSVVRGRE